MAKKIKQQFFFKMLSVTKEKINDSKKMRFFSSVTDNIFKINTTKNNQITKKQVIKKFCDYRNFVKKNKYVSDGQGNRKFTYLTFYVNKILKNKIVNIILCYFKNEQI